MSAKKRLLKTRLAEYNNAVSELGEVRSSLGEAYSRFENAADPDLLDACIFEISALRARYNRAVRNLKSLYF